MNSELKNTENFLEEEILELAHKLSVNLTAEDLFELKKFVTHAIIWGSLDNDLVSYCEHFQKIGRYGTY